jgi:hypothetical protein
MSLPGTSAPTATPSSGSGTSNLCTASQDCSENPPDRAERQAAGSIVTRYPCRSSVWSARRRARSA